VIRGIGSFTRGAGPRLATGVTREPIQFLFTAGVAEYDLMPGAREERAGFRAHSS
jgi:hypothetical protein